MTHEIPRNRRRQDMAWDIDPASRGRMSWRHFGLTVAIICLAGWAAIWIALLLLIGR